MRSVDQRSPEGGLVSWQQRFAFLQQAMLQEAEGWDSGRVRPYTYGQSRTRLMKRRITDLASQSGPRKIWRSA